MNISLRKMDWTLIGISVLLCVFGLVSIFSSSGENLSNFYKQLFFVFIGIVLMFLMSFYDNRNLRENSLLILSFYLVCVFFLIGLFFFAPEIRGIKSWYEIGIFSFSPIEPMKIILMLILAKYFSKKHVELYNLKHIIFSGIYIAIPAILIFLQPEIGSVIILLSIWIGILLVSGIRIREFMILFLIFLILFGATWTFLLKDYQKNRIFNFIAPQEDLLGEGWSQNQAKISIGSGGLIGKGIGNGSQTQYDFLPEPQTDFIFSAIAEETGFIGVTILFMLFLSLFWRIIRIALSAQSNFSRLFACGLAFSIFIQMVINIGMNLGVLPVIGIPLPLVSYGGSNLVFTFIAFGILQNMKITES
ncbi:MAG: rod shape-determining protein RodA [Candidatus Pacebacteria bacterium]|nr:rod shape-determining protein RodA [Candidatus Paceibacterota bacterium]MDD5013239.1 rod shape-determining protein RodA [Candidatus Paceibacterota bacterium]MDD5752760.1 rod shape-determining protein RodA [Candidatus Paceibacterota bacterium]